MLALLLGVVMGNILQGIAIGPEYQFKGSWLEFLNPYALMVGLTTLALMTMHGGIYLVMKTEGKLYERVNQLLWKSIFFFLITFIIVTAYTLIYIPHLSDRFFKNPILFVVPVLMFLSIANIPRLVHKRKFFMAFIFSSLTVSLLLILVAIELYPIMLISSVSPEYNLTVYNAASSDKSLGIMLTMAAIGTPLVIFYTLFVYKTFRGKVRLDESSY